MGYLFGLEVVTLEDEGFLLTDVTFPSEVLFLEDEEFLFSLEPSCSETSDSSEDTSSEEVSVIASEDEDWGYSSAPQAVSPNIKRIHTNNETIFFIKSSFFSILLNKRQAK